MNIAENLLINQWMLLNLFWWNIDHISEIFSNSVEQVPQEWILTKGKY